MRSTLCTVLAGLSLIPSIAISKIPASKMDPLVVKVVELLKADPTTSRNSQETRASDLSHCTTTAICPAKYGILISYTQKFQEENRLIIIEYTDYDDKNSENTPPYFQSDGIIGSADSLSIYVTFDFVRGKKLRFNYGFKDGGLDQKLDEESDSFYGDVLELGVSSKEAEDYYDEKRTEIDQKYTYFLRNAERRLTQKKE